MNEHRQSPSIFQTSPATRVYPELAITLDEQIAMILGFNPRTTLGKRVCYIEGCLAKGIQKEWAS